MKHPVGFSTLVGLNVVLAFSIGSAESVSAVV